MKKSKKNQNLHDFRLDLLDFPIYFYAIEFWLDMKIFEEKASFQVCTLCHEMFYIAINGSMGTECTEETGS